MIIQLIFHYWNPKGSKTNLQKLIDSGCQPTLVWAISRTCSKVLLLPCKQKHIKSPVDFYQPRGRTNPLWAAVLLLGAIGYFNVWERQCDILTKLLLWISDCLHGSLSVLGCSLTKIQKVGMCCLTFDGWALCEEGRGLCCREDSGEEQPHKAREGQVAFVCWLTSRWSLRLEGEDNLWKQFQKHFASKML